MTNPSQEIWTGGRSGEDPPRVESGSGSPVGAITAYVRALSQGPEASGALLGAAWKALRGALQWELRKKALWSGPPRHAGVYGFDTWMIPGGAADRSTSPLDELLQDCFSFVLIECVPQLIAQLRVRDDIEGFVHLYVRNFVHGRQKDHDPLGFRLFELLRSAVLEAQESEELFRLDGDPSIRNETVLSFSKPPSPEGRSSDPEPPVEDLDTITSGWASGAVADLFAVGPGSRRRAVERLRANLVELEAQGVRTFTFKAVLDGLKRDVRGQLASLLDLEQGETVVEVDDEGGKRLIRSLQPETWVEDIDSYRKLIACVSKFVAHAEGQERTRLHLERLWGFLRRYSAAAEDRFPTHRQLAHLLEIPRARFRGLLDTLGGFVRRCSDRASGKVVDGHFPEPPRRGGPRRET